MEKTIQEYKSVIEVCRCLFEAKMRDYGSSWRILRLSSLTDQIFIKANRIRSIQISQEQKIQDDIKSEFIGIVNYSVIALIQIELANEPDIDLKMDRAMTLYDKYVHFAYDLMKNKNHDYGEAWRSMRISSLTDIILVKILRIKQIEDNLGQTEVSEGLDANYVDMLNYAVFSLIKLNNNEK